MANQKKLYYNNSNLNPINMLTAFYIKLLSSALVGIVIAILAKAKAMNDKSKLTGKPLNFLEFISDDKISILSAIGAVVAVLLPLSELLNPEALIAVDKNFTFWIFQFSARAVFKAFVIFIMGFVGYAGMDLILKVYSVANSKVNKKLQEHNSEN